MNHHFGVGAGCFDAVLVADAGTRVRAEVAPPAPLADVFPALALAWPVPRADILPAYFEPGRVVLG